MKAREILRAIGRDFPLSLGRSTAKLRQHRPRIQCLRHQDADGAAKVVAEHAEGSGRHVIDQMRAVRGAA